MIFIGNQELTSSYARAKFVSGLIATVALIYHIIIQWCFFRLKVMPMFYYNFLSIAVFVFIFIAIFRVKSFVVLFFVAHAEIIVHQILAEYFLSSGTCFRFFILMMGLLPFLIFEKKIYISVPVALFSSLLFGILELVNFDAKYNISDNLIATIKFTNLTLTILVIIFMLCIFTQIVYKVETNLEAKSSNLEKEIKMAASIQQNFFKQNTSVIKNYQIGLYSKPMAGVSGDLFDFFRTGEHLDGLGIFDVSGHGISSGLVTMLVKNIIHQEFYTRETMDLWEILNNINGRVIEEKGDIENYLTGIIIRTNSNGLEIAIAGHPKPIIYHHKTGICEYFQPKKEAIGAIGIPGLPVYYTSEIIEFEKGDELFLYSDGLIDTLNEKKEDFGKTRLLNLIYQVSNLPVKTQVIEIEKKLAMFQGRASQNDDVTFMILKK